jgi:hypothetical protein
MKSFSVCLTLGISLLSLNAVAQTPSLEQRHANGVCLGRWTVTETNSVTTSTKVDVRYNDPYKETITATIPGNRIETGRDSSVAGAFKKLLADCDAWARNSTQAPRYEPFSQIKDSELVTHKSGGTLTPRKEYSYRGTCTGTHKYDVMRDNWKWRTERDDSSTTSLSQTTSTSLGVSKSQALADPVNFIGNSLKKQVGRSVNHDPQANRSTTIITDVRYNDPVFVSCSSADHLPGADLGTKADFLLKQVESMEARNQNSCSDPEFAAVQGTLWHVRLRDLNSMGLSQDIRVRIDEKAVKYPDCVLPGDTKPNFDSFDPGDFDIGGSVAPGSTEAQTPDQILGEKIIKDSDHFRMVSAYVDGRTLVISLQMRMEGVEYRLNLDTLDISENKSMYMRPNTLREASKADALYKELADGLKLSFSKLEGSNPDAKLISAYLDSKL